VEIDERTAGLALIARLERVGNQLFAIYGGERRDRSVSHQARCRVWNQEFRSDE